jgi:transposase
MTNDANAPMAQLEGSAMGLLRRARRTFEQMAEAGQRGLALIDQLEAQMPSVTNRCRQSLREAMERIMGPLPRG